MLFIGSPSVATRENSLEGELVCTSLECSPAMSSMKQAPRLSSKIIPQALRAFARTCGARNERRSQMSTCLQKLCAGDFCSGA